MLINIHTHRKADNQGKAIFNLYKDFEIAEPGVYYSAGLHPWNIGSEPEQDLNMLKNFARNEQVLAIGETGLDKICATNWEQQVIYFRKQIDLAGELNKPLIIHCVRAWEELLQILHESAVDVPVIFHGFNKGIHLAGQLIEKGYYLSFGQALEKEKMQAVLKTIPLQKFFLETDDATIPVSRVYEWAAKAFSIEMNAVHLQIQQNAGAVFGPLFTSNI